MRSDDPVRLTGDTEKRTPTEIAIIAEGNHLMGHKFGVIECPPFFDRQSIRGHLERNQMAE
ncbi:hypothetical protein [Vibrio sp. B1ASS3]|uniref:hypothetical protein n=1 Tax=Vibrio sp. B1ASS3 TaxID=2751176 RepID=UPI001ABAF630|nr:hypothetical protein [Vibrio sp. B1ASS3]